MIRYSPREIGERGGRGERIFRFAASVSRNVIRGNVEENGEQGRRWWAARKRKNPGGNGERRCTESHSPLSPSPSILWLNYSGRKIIQSPLLYRLSLEFYPEICSVGISPGNEEFFYLWTNSNTFDKVESDFSKSDRFFPYPFGSDRSCRRSRNGQRK